MGLSPLLFSVPSIVLVLEGMGVSEQAVPVVDLDMSIQLPF